MKLTKQIFGKLTRVFSRPDLAQLSDDEELIIDGVIIKNVKTHEKEDGKAHDNSLEKGAPGAVSDLDVIVAFCGYLDASGLAKRTLIEYKADLRIWANLAAENRVNLAGLKIDHVEKFLKKKDADTARRKIASLKSFSRWCLRGEDSGLFLELQKINYKARKIRIPKSMDFVDYKELIEKAKAMAKEGDRHGIWLCLMSLCGLRISEIRTANADMRTGYLRVIGKGNKERLVSCPQWLLDSLKKIKKENYQKSRQYIDLQLRKIGYQKFHRLRHTYATKLLSEKIPIDKIKDSLGHSSISTTQIYLKTEILENAHEYIEK